MCDRERHREIENVCVCKRERGCVCACVCWKALQGHCVLSTGMGRGDSIIVEKREKKKSGYVRADSNTNQKRDFFFLIGRGRISFYFYPSLF